MARADAPHRWHRAQAPRRDTPHGVVVVDIVRDGRVRADQHALPDRDAREQRYIGADPRARPDRDGGDLVLGDLVGPVTIAMVTVTDDDVGSDEDTIANRDGLQTDEDGAGS